VNEAAEEVAAVHASQWRRGAASSRSDGGSRLWRSEGKRTGALPQLSWPTQARRTCSSWRRPTIRSRSRHSRRRLPTQRPTCAFAFGARTGVRTIRMPSPEKTASKTAEPLLSRSWKRSAPGGRDLRGPSAGCAPDLGHQLGGAAQARLPGRSRCRRPDRCRDGRSGRGSDGSMTGARASAPLANLAPVPHPSTKGRAEAGQNEFRKS
jgi:hypothetical protein